MFACEVCSIYANIISLCYYYYFNIFPIYGVQLRDDAPSKLTKSQQIGEYHLLVIVGMGYRLVVMAGMGHRPVVMAGMGCHTVNYL